MDRSWRARAVPGGGSTEFVLKVGGECRTGPFLPTRSSMLIISNKPHPTALAGERKYQESNPLSLHGLWAMICAKNFLINHILETKTLNVTIRIKS